MTLKEQLKALPPDDYKILFEAFEAESTAVIKLPDNRFIGVNVANLPVYQIEEKQGYFSMGRIVE